MISCSLVSSRASIPSDIYILGLKSLITWYRSPISRSGFWSIHGFNTSINSRLFKDISPVLWSNPTLVLSTSHYYLCHIPFTWLHTWLNYHPIKDVRTRIQSEIQVSS